MSGACDDILQGYEYMARYETLWTCSTLLASASGVQLRAADLVAWFGWNRHVLDFGHKTNTLQVWNTQWLHQSRRPARSVASAAQQRATNCSCKDSSTLDSPDSLLSQRLTQIFFSLLCFMSELLASGLMRRHVWIVSGDLWKSTCILT